MAKGTSGHLQAASVSDQQGRRFQGFLLTCSASMSSRLPGVSHTMRPGARNPAMAPAGGAGGPAQRHDQLSVPAPPASGWAARPRLFRVSGRRESLAISPLIVSSGRAAGIRSASGCQRHPGLERRPACRGGAKPASRRPFTLSARRRGRFRLLCRASAPFSQGADRGCIDPGRLLRGSSGLFSAKARVVQRWALRGQRALQQCLELRPWKAGNISAEPHPGRKPRWGFSRA